MATNRLSTAQIQDRINSATSAYVNFDLLQDIVWSFVTDPDLMAELRLRAEEWREEMDETHPDE